MKKLFILAVSAFSALTMLSSCGKSEQPESVTPGGEEPVSREVTSIKLRSSNIDMDLSWTEGVVLDGIVCNPADTPLSSLRCTSSDESVVTVERDDYGFRIYPHKIGEATLTVLPSEGPASATCKVKVNENGITNAVEISKIELAALGSNQVSDYNSNVASFGLTITPAEVSANDLTIWSDRPELIEEIKYFGKEEGGVVSAIEGVLLVAVTVKKNTAHATTDTGIVNVYVKPKKGGAATQTFQLDVRGHIYKLEFPALQEETANISGGEVYLSKGESVKLEPKIYATGKLLDSDGLYWTSLDVAGVTVSDDWVMTLPDKSGGMMYNNGISVYCGDKSNAMAQRFEIKVHTYEKATGVSFSGISATTYYVGQKVSFTASVTPSNARQDLKVVRNGDGYLSLTRGTGANINRFTAEFTKGSKNKVQLSMAPVAGGTSGNVSMDVYDYGSSDVKVGDYVYYHSTAGFVNVDGGLRVYGHGEVLDTPKNPVSPGSGWQLVGIIYNRNVVPANFPITLKGDAYQKHYAVVSMKNGSETKWSVDKDGDIADEWMKHASQYGSAPVYGSATAAQVYKWNLGWALYNQQRGDSHDIKALQAVEAFRKSNTALAGSTGWLLMGTADARAIYDDIDILKTRFSKGGGDALTYAWTCQYDPQDNSKSYALKVEGSGVEKILRTSDLAVRPVCYL